MANINPLISFTEPVTRQDLFDMWNTGSFSEITVDDLADGFLPVIVGSTFSDSPAAPQPGQMYWHKLENVMYVYHDVIDDTGVSLWLAIGPDKFEVAMLAKTAVACGEAVELVGPGRTVQAYTPAFIKARLLPTAIGFNQSHIDGGMIAAGQGTDVALQDLSKYVFSNAEGPDSGATYYMGETAVTNEWIRVGIDGLVWMGSAPGSHPTTARAQWTTINSVALNDVPGLPGGIIGRDSNQEPEWNGIGGMPFYNLRAGGLTRTEPWWLSKGFFMPRMSQNDLFAT